MSRMDEARQVARELLDSLETTSGPIEYSIMKATRLARLLRDQDAQTWLDYESRGYPTEFNFNDLGSCRKYTVSGGRLTSDGRYFAMSLPEMEATRNADEAHIESIRLAKVIDPKAKDFLEAQATTSMMTAQIRVQEERKARYLKSHALFTSMRSALHAYATDVFLAIELGDIAQDIFENARASIDVFVRANCPKAAEQLVAISERMRDGTSESRSAALTSCRRLMMSVADAVFPPQAEPLKDGQGKARRVGQEEYKNRLLAHIEKSVRSGTTTSILATELEHLAARLDAVYEKSSKGVHVDVSEDEARLAVIETYLFLGQIARLS